MLTEALDVLISIVDQTGEVLPVGGFGKLDIRTQITAYLLGARAAVVLGRRPTASVEATEIAENLHLDAQRVREALSRLKNSFVAKTGGGSGAAPGTSMAASRSEPCGNDYLTG